MATRDPRILVDDEVWPELKRLAARKSRGAAVVVVPYVTAGLLELGPGDVLAADLSDRALAAGQTDPSVLLRYLKAGVRVHSAPGVHAKTYVLGDTAVVGSSNMSKSSQDALREVVVVLRDPAAVRSVREVAVTLLGPELSKSELDAAKAKYRRASRGSAPPKRPPAGQPGGPVPTAADRLWIIGLYDAGWPVTAEQKAQAARPGVRRRAGAAAQVEIGSALFDVGKAPALRIDDVVIEAWAPSKNAPLEEAYYPARVIELVTVPRRGRSPGWVIAYWRRPVGTAPISWADVQATAARDRAVLPCAASNQPLPTNQVGERPRDLPGDLACRLAVGAAEHDGDVGGAVAVELLSSFSPHTSTFWRSAHTTRPA